jgi:acetyl esterase/lipase
MTQYRGMDKAAIDAAYNNSAAIGGMEARDRFIAEVTKRSAALAARSNVQRNLAYGPGPRQTLDFFSCGTAAAPTLAFIHGGYWRSTEKEAWGYVAEGPLAHGLHVANIEYTLAPQNRMDGIVAEIRQAIAWLRANLARLGGDPGKLYVAGHSAGGHLTAMAITEPGVRGGIAISGVFDLEPIVLSSMNADIRLDAEEARRNSPQFHLPNQAPPLIVAVGGGELPEFLRQSDDYYAAWAAKGHTGKLLKLGTHNHFSVLDDLASPQGPLALAARDLAAGKI